MDFTPVFCTVFDKNYLLQGVTLHHSLISVVPNFKLYCLALDEITVQILSKLNLKNIIVVSLQDLPQNLLNEIKPLTSYGQFCWAMQPLICNFALSNGEPSITYIESDSYFFSSPLPLFESIGNYSSCVAPHWYSRPYKKYEKISGLYCTHFNFFRNNVAGIECLNNWKEMCFQYRKEKPLYYPGQLGLNDWPIKYPQVYEIENRGAGVAPWNVSDYQITLSKEGSPQANGIKVIFFHFHQLSRLADGSFELGTYPLNETIIRTFYRPYIRTLLKIEKIVKTIDPTFNYRKESQPSPSFFKALSACSLSQIRKSLQPIRRKLTKTYNIYPLQYFESET